MIDHLDQPVAAAENDGWLVSLWSNLTTVLAPFILPAIVVGAVGAWIIANSPVHQWALAWPLVFLACGSIAGWCDAQAGKGGRARKALFTFVGRLAAAVAFLATLAFVFGLLTLIFGGNVAVMRA